MRRIMILGLMIACFESQSQTLTPTNVIVTTLSFLEMNPNARIGAIGEIGSVASHSYSETGVYQNPSLLAGRRKISAVNYTHMDWEILNKLPFNNASLVFALDTLNSFGYSFTYMNWGEIEFYFRESSVSYKQKPNEFFHQLSYARVLSKSFSAGIAVKYIGSNLVDYQSIISKSVKTYAVDFGVNYAKTYRINQTLDLRMNIGSSITNFGPKISYLKSGEGKDFIPTTLKFGLLLNPEIILDNNSRLNIEAYYQAEKYLVPTPPIYTNNGDSIIKGMNPDVSAFKGLFQSFHDAPGGFKEEIHEIINKLGCETRLSFKNDVFVAARVGRLMEHITKGNRKYTTFGFGVGVYGFTIDFRNIKWDNVDNNNTFYSRAAFGSWALTLGFKSNLNNLFHF